MICVNVLTFIFIWKKQNIFSFPPSLPVSLLSFPGKARPKRCGQGEVRQRSVEAQLLMRVPARGGFQDLREVDEITLWWIKITERYKWQRIIKPHTHSHSSKVRWAHTFPLVSEDLSKMGISLWKWVNTKGIFHHFQSRNLTMELVETLAGAAPFPG